MSGVYDLGARGEILAAIELWERSLPEQLSPMESVGAGGRILLVLRWV